MTKKYLSDIIGDEYKEWNDEKIILDCGTSRGKTTFVIRVLGKYAFENNKRILYLCNRIKLKEQVELRIKEANLYNETVTVVSYQQLQNDILYNKCEYNDFDYIVADEIHYIFNDSTFNYYTDIAYEYLISQKDNVVIFMSATAKSIFNWLCSDQEKIANEKRRYKLEADYSYVNQVIFYNRKELTSIIDKVLATNEEDKIVAFINDSNKMLELYEKYKDIAHFYCSEKSEKLEKIREADCIKAHCDNYITFEKRILFSTIALDNGVDLKDEKIKYIISEIFEPDTAIQCLGRKRPINDNDTCTFYIADYKKADITRYNNQNNAKLEPLTMFYKHKEDFINQYGKKREWHTRYIYNDWENNGIPKLNLVGYYKLCILKLDIMSMLNRGYQKSLCEFNLSKELVGKVANNTVEEKSEKELLDYLKKNVGRELFEDRGELKEKFKNAGFNKSTIGLKLLNVFLNENGYDYRIISQRSKRTKIDKKQPTAWIVKRN